MEVLWYFDLIANSRSGQSMRPARASGNSDREADQIDLVGRVPGKREPQNLRTIHSDVPEHAWQYPAAIGVKEEMLGPKVKRYAKQHQGNAQHNAVPERQANAQALKHGRPCLL